jgi:integrase
MVKLRKKKLQNGEQSLYLDFYTNGKRTYEFLKIRLTSDKLNNKEVVRLAEGIRAKRELEYQNQQYGFVPLHKSKINFVDYFEKMALEKDRRNTKCYKNTLNYLKRFTKGHIQLSQIDEKWIKEFQSYMLGYISNNAVWTYMNSLKAAINRAYREKLIQSNPLHYFSGSGTRDETKKEYLTFDEIKKLAEAECGHPEVKRGFLFCCFTGLRYSDVTALEWKDIKDDTMNFRQKKTRGLEYLPLSETAIDLLYQHSGNVLNMNSGKVFEIPGQTHTNETLKKWVKNAGINKKITFHNSRHTFATLSLTQGIDLYTVSKLLGHCKLSVTEIYAKIVDTKKREAVKKLPYINIS